MLLKCLPRQISYKNSLRLGCIFTEVPVHPSRVLLVHKMLSDIWWHFFSLPNNRTLITLEHRLKISSTEVSSVGKLWPWKSKKWDLDWNTYACFRWNMKYFLLLYVFSLTAPNWRSVPKGKKWGTDVMSQTLECRSMKDKEEQVISFFKECFVFFFFSCNRKEKRLEKKFYSTAIYNLPPLQRHKVITETSLEK